MRPPWLAEWLLRVALPRDRQNNAIRGDLLEEFRRRGSRRWYWREALSLIVRSHGYQRMLTLDNLRQDVRFAWRSFAKAPAFTGIVIITIALGIGSSTAIFSAVYGVLLKPLPFPEPDRLLWINEMTLQGQPMSVSWPNYLDWRARAHSFETLAASRTDAFTWTGNGDAIRLDGRRVTANFFDALGIRPAIGRGFSEADDRAGAPFVAIITHEFATHALGGDAQPALGRVLMLDGRPFTIVGVLPPGFRYLRRYDLFVAMGAYIGDGPLQERGNHAGYYALGRLRRGVHADTAAAELQDIERAISREHPESVTGISVGVELLASRLVSSVRQTLLVLFGAVGLLLLIACMNVANLLISRGAARRHELAVRAALGGGRVRLATQLLVESTLLSAMGGALGVGLASALLRLLIAFAPEGTPRMDEVQLDGRALLFAVAAATGCGILFGAFPAAHGSGVSAQQALVRVRGAASARTNALRRALLVVEVALAVILLAGAGLMVRTLLGLTGTDAGFRLDHLLTAHLSVRGERWTHPRRTAFIDQLVAGTRALPGVTSAAASSALAIDGSDWNSIFIAADKPVPVRRDLLAGAAFTLITAGYFETMGTPVLRGRAFTAADRAGSPHVVVVNESLARTIWPGEDPIGKRIKQSWPEAPTPWREVVGVVRDVKFEGVTEPAPMQVYLPIGQDPPREFFIAARTAGDPSAVASALAAAVHDIDRDVPLYDVRPMTQVMASSIAQHRMAELVLAMFATVALLLASIGLYGLVSHSVTERTHEIGLRLALGAERKDVIRVVVHGGLSATLVGAVIGLAGAALMTGSMRSLLFGVRPLDPLTFGSVVALLLATATVACVVPAWRAVQIPPTTALRTE